MTMILNDKNSITLVRKLLRFGTIGMNHYESTVTARSQLCMSLRTEILFEITK